MKKILTGLLIAALAVSAGATTASAAKPVYGRHYADCNEDGICDYCGQKDGCNLEICNVKGKYFVDKDGDGFCDHCTDGSSKCKTTKKYKKYCRSLKNYESSQGGHHKHS